MGNSHTKHLDISSLDLSGKVCIITGANGGIGFIAAREIAKTKARVILACRGKEKGEEAKKKIVDISKNENVEVMSLDLSSLGSVRKFCEEFRAKNIPLHILINNAGIMNVPFQKTVDGFESQFAVNHLGHFLLVNLLLDILKNSKPSRIVTISSFVHFKGTIQFDDLNGEKQYKPSKAYRQSKLANVLFTYELSRKLEGTGVTANAVNPGFVKTELFDHQGLGMKIARNLIAKSPDEGASTGIFVAVHPDLEGVTGKYFSDCKEEKSSDESYDEKIQKNCGV